VIPGVSHHITQRGNRRQQVFFSDDDYRAYLDFLGEWGAREGLLIQAFCLMPNHVHIIAIPSTEKSLHRAVKEVHRRYSCRINLREGWRGFLWQGRFSSFPMDEAHLYYALHYVENNPVRAGLVATAADWRWSSARYRSGQRLPPFPLEPLPFSHDTSHSLSSDDEAYAEIRHHERTGRPFAERGFIQELEARYGLQLLPKKRGPKPKE
jgi:putative transposase